jgi:hypothetical protein
MGKRLSERIPVSPSCRINLPRVSQWVLAGPESLQKGSPISVVADPLLVQEFEVDGSNRLPEDTCTRDRARCRTCLRPRYRRIARSA